MMRSDISASFQDTDVAKEPIARMLSSLDEYRKHLGQYTPQPTLSLINVYNSSFQISDKIESILYKMMFSRL